MYLLTYGKIGDNYLFTFREINVRFKSEFLETKYVDFERTDSVLLKSIEFQ